MADPGSLSRRERQIMDAIYRLGEATAQEVLDHLPDPPSYSAVRALLRVLVEKGHVKHREDGTRYVYAPVVSREQARRNALKQMVRTFFDGSAAQAAAALLNLKDSNLSDDELDRLEALIDRARAEDR
ncbi:MAG: BlaI/MecI/CopY family transcriptional regulator [Gemmatimonadaceae bacterium]|nr:BlaI/MecI/CopY family transcriptional regulator [Gemmatimonadaceae bacterium]